MPEQGTDRAGDTGASQDTDHDGDLEQSDDHIGSQQPDGIMR